MRKRLYDNNQEVSPKQNQVKVLELIRNKKEITRADIIRLTGLSAPTVTRVIDVLLDKKLIRQDELGTSNGGRPPQIIRFDSQNNYVIGIDIGATFVRAALSNLDGEFIYEIHLPTAIENGFDGVMEQVGELIEKLSDRAAAREQLVFGIGISVCGIVNSHTGMVDYSPVFDWVNADVKKALKKYTDLRIAIGNVAHLIAHGELLYGIGKKYDHFISINLGYGIGSGIIINRQPFYGADGYAGEIGHIVVDPNSSRKGREGICGTLEALASGYGIADIVKEKIDWGESTSLSEQPAGSLSAKTVMKAAIAGDLLAIRLIDDSASYVGISIDTLIKLFNPQAITLSGGLVDSSDFFIDKIKQKVTSVSLPPHREKVPILNSSFGEEASLMGAFSLILQHILRLE